MSNPKSFYETKIRETQSELKRLKRQSSFLSAIRLSIFFLVALFIYLYWGDLRIISVIVISGIALFLFLISKHADVKNRMAYHKKLIEICQIELDALSGDLSKLKTGDQYIYEEHYYNQDIDLFGSGSLFQLVNRTETVNGEKRLAFWLNSNDINRITEKQIAIKELSAQPEWRQHYKATAALMGAAIEVEDLLNWVKNYKTAIPAVFNYLPIIFSAISVLVFSLYWVDIIPSSSLIYVYFIGFGITGIYLKKINRLYYDVVKLKETFSHYSKLIEAIEGEEFKSDFLTIQQRKVKTEGVKASKILKKLSKEIDYLSNRNNMIFALIGNGFLLWDLRYAYRIERWIANFDADIENWFDAIEYFDAVNSLANFAFNNPEYTYPEIRTEGNVQISAKKIGHPLLRKDKMVTNDIEIKKEDFFIITGANMAGKSTFLRTVALNIVMANCGLPVSSETFSYQPVKLISSMRTSDSLQNDESYFFAELKRLKFIVDEINNDTYFIILDEILKGTNSVDKAEGSKKFVEKLVASSSTGLIATHDLSLCQLSEKLPQIQNYYFDATISNDELFFDYTFKKGICQNMNASFLLKKMKII